MSVHSSVGQRCRPVLVLATIIPASLFSLGAINLAQADNAESSTSSSHNASSGGDGSSVAGGTSSESSTATANQNGANGSADVGVGSSASQSGPNGNSAVSVDAGSDASATTGNSENTASANADVTLNGNAQEATANANAGTTSGAGATATNGDLPRASAYTTNGGYATAEAGGGAVAYQPGASSNTYSSGETIVVIAYTDQGSYSMAISDSRSARALAGTTNETVALSRGQIRAILKSSTYAEAYADRDFAWAEAWAEGDAQSGTNKGFSSASGRSYARAKANRKGNFMSVETDISVTDSNNKNFASQCSKRSKAKNSISCSSPGGTNGSFKVSSRDHAGLTIIGKKQHKAKSVPVRNAFADDDDIANVSNKKSDQRSTGKKVNLPRVKKLAVKTAKQGRRLGSTITQQSAFAVDLTPPKKKRWLSVGDFIDKSDMPVQRKAKLNKKNSIKVVKRSNKPKQRFMFEDL